MRTLKNTQRACVESSFNGVIRKRYYGKNARRRFENEVRVLRHLEQRGCEFVPRLLDADPRRLEIQVSDCGTPVENIDRSKVIELFEELLSFGVRHDDQEVRNLLYCGRMGRFTVIDFEFAEIVEGHSVVASEQRLDRLEALVAAELESDV